MAGADEHGPLVADRDVLTMLQAYEDAGMRRTAAFEGFVRTPPAQRIFLVAAGLEQAIDFLEALPEGTVFVPDAPVPIDTDHTEAAAREVAALAPRLAREGIALQPVRIDSGDLGEPAARVRAILDAAGLGTMTIFAGGNLDERRVDVEGDRVRAGALTRPRAAPRAARSRIRPRAAGGSPRRSARRRRPPAARRSTDPVRSHRAASPNR
jgi:hypothetical protein